ncbi:hypothetical protein BN1002_03585 [Bacillus sp. B-jedd]|nr:hypothetical protein BN1002_03585 [Bacillus sp. B-jedd]
MKVTINNEAKQQLVNVFGAEPTVKINQVRTTG